jgi:hypothetical protein
MAASASIPYRMPAVNCPYGLGDSWRIDARPAVASSAAAGMIFGWLGVMLALLMMLLRCVEGRFLAGRSLGFDAFHQV